MLIDFLPWTHARFLQLPLLGEYLDGRHCQVGIRGGTGAVRSLCRGHRFPSEIISHAVWLYHRFTLSFRDVEDLLAERGVTVSHEAIRLCCRKSGTTFARDLCRRHGRLGDVWHVVGGFITMPGQRRYLWRAAGQDGPVTDILVTRKRDRRAAKRFFRKA